MIWHGLFVFTLSFYSASANGCGQAELDKLRQCHINYVESCNTQCTANDGHNTRPTPPPPPSPPPKGQSCFGDVIENAKTSFDACTKTKISTFPSISMILQLTESPFVSCPKGLKCMEEKLKNAKTDATLSNCISEDSLGCSFNETSKTVCDCGQNVLKEYQSKFMNCRLSTMAPVAGNLNRNKPDQDPSAEARRLIDSFLHFCSPMQPVDGPAKGSSKEMRASKESKGAEKGASKVAKGELERPPPPPPKESKASIASGGSGNKGPGNRK